MSDVTALNATDNDIKQKKRIKKLVKEIKYIKRYSDDLYVLSMPNDNFGTNNGKRLEFKSNETPYLAKMIGGNDLSKNFYTIGMQYEDKQIQRSFCSKCGNYRRELSNIVRRISSARIECNCYGEDDKDESEDLFDYLYEKRREMKIGAQGFTF